jgi:hypothetical protein
MCEKFMHPDESTKSLHVGRSRPASARQMNNLSPQTGIFIALAQYTQRRVEPSMIKIVTSIALACAGIHAQAAVQPRALPAERDAFTGSFWNEAIQNYWNTVPNRAIAATKTAATPDWRANGLFANRVSDFFDAHYRYDSWRRLAAIPASDTNRNRNTVPNPYWVPNGNIRADAPYPGAYAVIELFHFRSGLTTLFRRIL